MKKQILIWILIISTASVSCGEPQFKTLKSGLQYKLLSSGKSKKKAVEGSIVSMHMISMVGDSVIYNSAKANAGKTVPGNISKPAFNGDIMEGLLLMSEGDSSIIRVLADSLFRSGMPEFIKAGDTMSFIVKLVTVKSKEEYNAELEAAAKKQNEIDDKLISAYLSSKQIQAEKTPSGIYYVIEKKGNGMHPSGSDKVSVHYKGTTLDGTKFDSSYDRGEPAEFGLDQVIKGWTEGIPLFEEGGKGTLIIPSSLAYGENPPPNAPIKPNEILMFEVELLKIIK